MLVTSQTTNNTIVVLELHIFTLVCVEEDIDTTPTLQLYLVIGGVTNMA